MRRRYLLLLCLLVTGFWAVQAQSKVAGAKLPLVTAGTVLRWAPSGDEVSFQLPETSWIKLSIYSPSIDENNLGDVQYDEAPLEASFSLVHETSDITLQTKRFSLGPSNWLTFFEGPASEGRYSVQSQVQGHAKNVYLLKLETERDDIELVGETVTVNASSSEWQDAFSFNISRNEPCQLELYDGDGQGELEARLQLPTNYVQMIPVSEDLAWTTQHLPRLTGVYTVQLRLPEDRVQKTNSVRFAVRCAGNAQRLTLMPSSQIEAPVLGDIAVEIVDTNGQVLDIPYLLTGRFERSVTLAEDSEYRLVTKQVELGQELDERSVGFGLEGGKVIYVLEKLLEVPQPDVLVQTMPEVEEAPPSVSEAPKLKLEREFSHTGLLACQHLGVTLRISNLSQQTEAFSLREEFPTGFVLSHSAGAMVNENSLIWQGDLEPGEVRTLSYQLEVSPVSGSLFRAVLDSAVGKLTEEASFLRLETTTSLERISPEGPLYAGDEIELLLTLTNPLAEDIEVSLEPARARLSILEGPKSVEVPANGYTSVVLRALVESEGNSVLQLSPFVCAEGVSKTHVSGPAATFREEVLALPELPSPVQSTTVTIDIAAFDLPVIDGLVLVQALPEGVTYVAGSTLINAESAPDPLQAGRALIFEWSKSLGSVQFTVLHQTPYVADKADSSVLVLAPEPEVLIGDAEALELYEAAVPISRDVAVRERVGAVILSPTTASLIRTGNTSSITVDTDLEDQVALFVNDGLVTEDRIGKRTLDSNISRQTFEYIGVELTEGPNTIRLESTNEQGDVATDEILLYVAGAPAQVRIIPLQELLADSALPLRFEVRVQDAWGNAPIDSYLTLEIAGAQAAVEDANQQQIGYQIAFENGVGELVLAPPGEPGEIRITSFVNQTELEERFEVKSDLRPWIVAGYGSVGAAYEPSAGFKFGVGASFFARGRIFDDYLLTLAGNYPLDPLGDEGSKANSDLPITGSSSSLSRDAFSRHGVYARLERNQSYLQYGDFVTNLEGSLLRTTRPYTGLSGQYKADTFSLRSYLANTATSDRVNDLYIPADGTRVYTLPDRNVLADTLQLEVVKGACEVPRDFASDNDPFLKRLSPAVDYTFDQEVSRITLNLRLPSTDAVGRCYYLLANYQLEPGTSSQRAWQFGVQGFYNLDRATLRLGLYQENLSNAFARVISAGSDFSLGALQADVELAYGQNQETGGIAAVLRTSYVQGPLIAEARYQIFTEGYRSATVTDDSSAGHDLSVSASYAFSPQFLLSADGQVRYHNDKTFQLRFNTLANYISQGDVSLADTLLGRDFSAQFGLQYELNRESFSALSALAGVSLRDIFGLSRTELSILHNQGIASSSTTEFSIGYQLLDNLVLRLTDRLVWGQSNFLVLGLEAGFENSRVLAILCRLSFCELNDPTVNLGLTRVTAEYEFDGGLNSDTGRIRLGLESEYPVTEALALSFGANQTLDLADSMQNETVVSLGARYDTEDLSASAGYDVRFAVTTKHFFFSNVTAALSDKLYFSVRADYLRDPSLEAVQGVKLNASVAYRGDAIGLLSSHTWRSGNFSASGESELSGDFRATLPFNERFSLRTSYLYDLQAGLGYRDMITLGATAYTWQGGSITGYGHLFHNWSNQTFGLGASVEVAQELGCGVYGVAGYNFFDGTDIDRGSVFARPGVFVRLDVVFDEEWRCGYGEIQSRVFIDQNDDGVLNEDEESLAGIRAELYDLEGKIVAVSFSNVSGALRFRDVAPGRYQMVLDIPEGYSKVVAVALPIEVEEIDLSFGEILEFDIPLRPLLMSGEE